MNDLTLLDSEPIIRQFVDWLWDSRTAQLKALYPNIILPPPFPPSLYSTALAEDLRQMATAAAGLIDRTPVSITAVSSVCAMIADWLFAPSAAEHANEVPEAFSDSPIGWLWWRANLWCLGDELISMAEAARILGVNTNTINWRIRTGKLRHYLDPLSRQSQRHTLVLRSEIMILAAQKSAKETTDAQV